MKTVYLDSSVISRCADGKSSIVEIVRKSTGRIKLASSISHVIEALPKNETHVETAIKRLRIITDEDIALPLRAFFEVPQIECGARYSSLKNLTCDWHELYPLDQSEDIALRFKTEAKDKIKAQIAEILDANERRKLRAKLFLRGKYREENIKSFLENQRISGLKNAEINFPELIPLFGKDGIYDAIIGKADSKKFRYIFTTTLMHPVVLAKMAFNPELEIRSISEFFWDQGAKYAKSIQNQIESFAKLSSESDRTLEELLVELGAYLATPEKQLEMLKIFCQNFNEESIEHAPGAKNFMYLLSFIMLKKIRAHADPAKKIDYLKTANLARGDYGDITHTVYQPYVDYFFCDKRTAAALQSQSTRRENIFSDEIILAEELNKQSILQNKP